MLHNNTIFALVHKNIENNLMKLDRILTHKIELYS